MLLKNKKNPLISHTKNLAAAVEAIISYVPNFLQLAYFF